MPVAYFTLSEHAKTYHENTHQHGPQTVANSFREYQE